MSTGVDEIDEKTKEKFPQILFRCRANIFKLNSQHDDENNITIVIIRRRIL